jgi:hypothetical protein
LASTILILAFLAEGKIQTGSRLKAACTNPQNSQSMNAHSASRKIFSKMEYAQQILAMFRGIFVESVAIAFQKKRTPNHLI